MGALGDDTAVEPVGSIPGRFGARLARDWETWGPNGGYLASVALRAAGAATRLSRPATLSCLFLGVGTFEDVDIEVTSIRSARRSEALRVSIAQGDRALLEAHVGAIETGLAGLEHDVAVAPQVPGPDELKSMAELRPDDTPHLFWRNFDIKPVSWVPEDGLSPSPPPDPDVRQWLRFAPVARYEDDPWLDACRTVVLLDTFQWPAAHRAHVNRAPEAPAYIAPNIDLSVRFHRSVPTSEWLLIDARSPIAESGLMTGEARVWSEDRRLVASASSHLLCREVPLGTPGSGTVAR